MTKSHADNEDEEGGSKKGEGGEDEENEKDMEHGEVAAKLVVTKLCLVLEYCPRGSLFDCLIRRREKVSH